MVQQRGESAMALNPQIPGRDQGPEINTTPLIDVMLVLLTLLIVTLPIQTHAVKLDMGQGPKGEARVVDIVAIDFDGSLKWNGHAVDRTTLDDYLSQAARDGDQPEIHVSADRLARYDSVAKVLADAQRLGVTRIGVVGTDAFLHDTKPLLTL
jgi:biopolymer transport protein ExbD